MVTHVKRNVIYEIHGYSYYIDNKLTFIFSIDSGAHCAVLIKVLEYFVN